MIIDYVEMKNKFHEDGYVVFNIEDDFLIECVNRDVEALLSNPQLKTNSKIYSYNESPRIVESHKHSEACRRLAKAPRVISIISKLFGRDPLPFSTINFLRSTQQPLHSDYVHFGTIPELLLVGSWVALEDIDPRSGPLQVVPGSHKFPPYELFEDVKDVPKNLAGVKSNYTRYEQWVLNKIASEGLVPYTPSLKKGDCILWDANLLHGSPDCMDNSLSRRSQVTHWSFVGVQAHYNPNFSKPSQGIFANREVEYF